MDRYTLCAPEDIIWCEAVDGYARIHFVGGDSLLLAKSLSRLEEFLPKEHFERAHNKALVNLRHIRSIEKNDGKILLLSNGHKVPVSSHRWKVFIGRFKLLT